MKSPHKGPRPDMPAELPAVRFSEVLLRSEVLFWREMLTRECGSLPAESLERIRQALALAEYRLMAVVLESGGPGRSSDGPGPTSRGRDEALH